MGTIEDKNDALLNDPAACFKPSYFGDNRVKHIKSSYRNM